MSMLGGFRNFDDGPSIDSSGRSDARQARQEARHLDDRLEKLLLVNVALWSLLQEKTGLTEADLMERVRLLDEMDGQADGKAERAKVTSCGACGRPVSARQAKCMYCGAQKKVSSAYDMV